MQAQIQDVAGWRASAPTECTVSRVLADRLADLGVREAFGLIGGGIAPFGAALLETSIAVRHFRHEAGAAFAATEASLATGRPVAVFLTTGPGLTNALTGLIAARWDGAHVIAISGATSPAERGRGAVQETSSYALGLGLGPIFNLDVEISSADEIDEIVRRLAAGVQRPGGFVAHLSIPISVQASKVARRASVVPIASHAAGPARDAIDECAALLAAEPFAIWAGFGARHASRELLELVERTGAPVMCSPRAKGVFPERHPRFVGVTGAGGHDSAEAFRARNVLVLGSKLGEVTSFFSTALVPPGQFIHVDLDPEAAGVAYPTARVLAVQSDTREFLRALRMPRVAYPPPVVVPLAPPEPLAPRDGSIRRAFLMQAVQRVVIDDSDAVVMTEAGNSFTWGNHVLRFDEPNRYRTSAAWGSMGHFTTGVVGAVLASGRRAVAIVGDGAMLMNNEISTAVRYEVPCVWVVLNDAQYGLNEHAMRALGYTPVETAIPRVNFVAFARSMGACGERITSEAALDEALERALTANRPYVIDVIVDPDEISPIVSRRVESLKRQGAA